MTNSDVVIGRRRRRLPLVCRPPPQMLLLWVLFVLSCILGEVSSTVSIPQYNVSYSSMPAMFGQKWPEKQSSVTVEKDDSSSTHIHSYGPSSFVKVQAHLQWIPNRSLLCRSEEEKKHTTEIYNITQPEDRLPVVLLAERGECTFWEKAQVASELLAEVEGKEDDNSSMIHNKKYYLMVYDNIIDNPGLVPMSSGDNTMDDNANNITLLFVSYHTGIALKEYTFKYNNITNADHEDIKFLSKGMSLFKDGGLMIEMDGYTPNPLPQLPPQLTLTGYFLAALTGFLAFLIFFGCVLMCAQFGIIQARSDERGQIILFGPGSAGNNNHQNNPRQVAMRIMSNGRLTKHQIKTFLDEEVYSAAIRCTRGGEGSFSRGLDDDEVKQKEIEAQFEEQDTPTTCAICLDEFEDKETIRKLPCEHKFHDACLIPWLTERHSTCPLCKFDVLDYIIEKRISDSQAKNKNTTTTEREDDDEMQEDYHQRPSQQQVAVISLDNDNSNTNNNTSPLSILWLHLRRFSGWTLVDTTTTTTSTATNLPEENGENDTARTTSVVFSAGEIEMEATATTMTSPQSMMSSTT